MAYQCSIINIIAFHLLAVSSKSHGAGSSLEAPVSLQMDCRRRHVICDSCAVCSACGLLGVRVADSPGTIGISERNGRANAFQSLTH